MTKVAMRNGTLAAAMVVLLAACGEGDEQQGQQATPMQGGDNLVDFSQQGPDINEQVLKAIQTKPVKGGEIVPRPGILVFDVPENGSHKESVRFSNHGDAPVSILKVITTTEQRGLVLSGPCTDGPEIEAGDFCDLDISYEDRTGRSLDTSIFMTTDSKLTPQVTVNLSINIERDDEEPEEPLQPSIVPPVLSQKKPDVPKQKGPDPRIMQLMAEGRSIRNAGAMGRVQMDPSSTLAGLSPEKVIRNTDPRYDPEAYLWTQSSLPVDRGRILTVDRVIPAVLETPVTNIMCNQVIAVIDKDVHSPDSRNILIPHGSRAVGQCQAFADERVNIQWTRIITPNGVSIRFNNLLGDSSDAGGHGGVAGRLLYKRFDRYGLPLISTSLDFFSGLARAVFGETQESNVNNETNTTSQTISAVDQALNEVNDRVTPQLQQIIKDISDIREMVIVPGGTRIEIVAQEDIYFKTPYEAVRLADIEYDVRHPVMPPTLLEQMPPTYMMQPEMNGGRARNTIELNGRHYTLEPAPLPADPSQPAPSPMDNAAPSSVVYPSMGAGAPGTTSYVPNAAGAPDPQGAYGQPSYPGSAYRGAAVPPVNTGNPSGPQNQQPYAYGASTGMAYPQAQAPEPYYGNANSGTLPDDSLAFSGQRPN